MSITLDDRDPAFAYTGPWAKMAAGSDYDGTSTWTNLSISTVNISFTGVQITVFGTIAPIGTSGLVDGPTTFYTVDNSSTKQPYTATQQADAQYHQQFFQSEVLTSGNHTLQIQYLANTGEYILDYAQIAITTPTASPSSSTVPSSTVPSSTVPSSTVSAISAPSKHHSSPTIPVVVGVVGGLILIGLIINGVIMWRKRKSKVGEKLLLVSAGNVTPFHPQPLQTEERTISTFVTSREAKSITQLPPPAYENPDYQPTNDTHVVA